MRKISLVLILIIANLLTMQLFEGAIGLSTIKKVNIQNDKTLLFFDDEEDQSQKNAFYKRWVSTYYNIAQSFKPSLPVLTRVKLYLNVCTEGEKVKIKLCIRQSLDGSGEVTKSIECENGGARWYEFDFTDINVNTGCTYYILVKKENAGLGFVEWYYDVNDPYKSGCAYVYEEHRWKKQSRSDQAFITYGRDDGGDGWKLDKIFRDADIVDRGKNFEDEYLNRYRYDYDLKEARAYVYIFAHQETWKAETKRVWVKIGHTYRVPEGADKLKVVIDGVLKGEQCVRYYGVSELYLKLTVEGESTREIKHLKQCAFWKIKKIDDTFSGEVVLSRVTPEKTYRIYLEIITTARAMAFEFPFLSIFQAAVTNFGDTNSKYVEYNSIKVYYK